MSVSFKDFQSVGDLNSLTSLLPPSKQFPHREKEAEDIMLNLMPVLKNQRAPNFFVFGPTGTGKTAILRAKIDELVSECRVQGVALRCVYVNCGETRNSTTSLLKVCKQLSPYPEGITSYGHQWAYVASLFEGLLKSVRNVIIVLDEVDKLIQEEGDKLLYYLTRLKDQEGQTQNVSVIIVSNNVNVPQMLSTGTESSFGKLKVEFFGYDADQLRDILQQRISEACLNDEVEEGVTSLAAAFGAQLHGNARQTLELFKNAYLLAKKEGKSVTVEMVRKVYERTEYDLTIESVRRLPVQQKIFLLATLDACQPLSEVTTPSAYRAYEEMCRVMKRKPVSVRSVQQFIKEMEQAGLIETEKVRGLTRERLISLQQPKETLKKMVWVLKANLYEGVA